ncbi:hypothetical protein C7C46_27825 [Streptomyces tateyamensis]|uniref:Uncharacterized protein n=1 Tax=Streptomyces tateyamensis TaxID=565073 RepID=A0A2V4NIU6_9ACTN|nr:hypothetical protein [Streptomyces tateyamensis]PYC69778.1 hypothetical protein C7C46_27825 [Streptomyces tateyamensis]
MSHALSPLDRLRIERVVWALDQQLYDLPRSSRIAIRREVRTNLLTASADLGTAVALRRIGGSRQLAEGYLSAEYGEGPRHSWNAAACFAALVPLVLISLLSEAANAYQQGILAADPQATGTFGWHGISYLQSAVTFTLDHGRGTQSGGAWTPLTYGLWVAGTIACGRLWRTLPWWRNRRRTVQPATD